MAEQIDSLFVRLGLETDQKEFKEAESQFSGLHTTILRFAAAIGAGIGLDELTRGFANSISEVERFSDLFSVEPQFVQALKFAFGEVGGASDDAFQSIRQVRDLLEQTEWGELSSEAFRVAGFDPRMLEGVTSVAEAYERISESIEGMDPEKARRALTHLGFGEEAIRLFKQGPDQLRAALREGAERSPVTDEMTQQAIEFDKAVNALTSSMDGVKNEISTLFVGDLAETVDEIADFLKDNRDEIKEFADTALPYLKNIAAALGVLVAIQSARSALGIFKNVPFLTGVAAAAATYAWENSGSPGEFEPPPEEQVRSQRERMDRMNQMPEGLSIDQQRRFMRGEEVQVNNDIKVDARGSTDPKATEEAARRGTERALQDAAENTERDLRGPDR